MKISFGRLASLGMFLGFAGTGCAWVFVDKFSGREAANAFFKIGIVVLLTLFILQLIIWLMGERRVFCQALFRAVGALVMIWYLGCIFFPLFWMTNISHLVKLGIGFFTLYLSMSNMLHTIAYFEDKWDECGEGAFPDYFNRRLGTVRWDELLGSMRLSVDLRIPGVPEDLVAIISGASIFFMIVGLNLRHAFPVFSAFAYGLPCGLVISCMASAAALNLAQASRVLKLEKHVGGKLYVD